MRTVLITGASGGLGWETAKRLVAQPGVRVLAGVRRPAAMAEAASWPRGEGSALEVVEVDLMSRASVAAACARIQAPLHAMIFNAGVQGSQEDRWTLDGHEETFGVNHLAHLWMYDALERQLVPGARVIFLGSGTHDPSAKEAQRFGFRGGLRSTARALAAGHPGEADGPWAPPSPAQLGRDRYATSKLYNIAAALALAAQHPPSARAFFAFDPGLMAGTGLARQHGVLQRLAWRYVLPLVAAWMPRASTPARSAETLAWLALEPSLGLQTGAYVRFDRAEIPPAALARDPWVAREALDGARAL